MSGTHGPRIFVEVQAVGPDGQPGCVRKEVNLHLWARQQGKAHGLADEAIHAAFTELHVSFRAPGYWMNETSGVLRPVIEAYLLRQPLDGRQVATMRSYLRQWIAAPAWSGPEIEGLRARVDGLTDQSAITRWLIDATAAGLDPL